MSHLCCAVQNETYGQVPRNIFDTPSQWVTQTVTINLKCDKNDKFGYFY